MYTVTAPEPAAGQHEDVDALMDQGGFMRDPRAWNTALAAAIARRDGLPELTADHWQVIRELRAHFERFGIAPPAFCHICVRHHLGAHCVERLFHSERAAWRIAGLPDPGEEARAYM